MLYRHWEECDGALAQIKACWLVQYYRPEGMAGGEGVGFDRSKIPWCLSFFLLFLALATTLFSRAGRVEQCW